MAMGILWALMLLAGTVYSLLHGTGAEAAAGAMEGAAKGIQAALALAGPLCLWTGVSRAMDQSGLSRSLSRLLSPVLKHLFPKAAKDLEALSDISGNVTANLLGLGNAATPMGIRAVRRLQQGRGNAATEEVCRLVVLNTASIQLLPTTVAALRAAEGSAAPFDILPAVWLTSLCALAVGLLAAWLLERLMPHG